MHAIVILVWISVIFHLVLDFSTLTFSSLYISPRFNFWLLAYLVKLETFWSSVVFAFLKLSILCFLPCTNPKVSRIFKYLYFTFLRYGATCHSCFCLPQKGGLEGNDCFMTNIFVYYHLVKNWFWLLNMCDVTRGLKEFAG